MSKLMTLYRYLSFEDKKSQGFVTISRQAGAGGITIGAKLAEYLNETYPEQRVWTVFDKTLVDEVIREYDIPMHKRLLFKEDYIPAIDDLARELLGSPSQLKFVERTNRTILNLSKIGHAIIVGRGSSIVTQFTPGGVHVRLVGSLKNRNMHLQEYYQYTAKEAAAFIEKEDKGRKRYIKKYFGRDIDDPLLYDVVINTDNISYDEAAILIRDVVMKRIKNQLTKEHV